MAARKGSEHKEQQKFFEYCAWKGIKDVFAIPNGTRCTPAARKWMLNEGMKKGVPDIFVAIPTEHRHGLFIEMKFGKNTTTKEQREWLARLQRAKYACAVCKSADQAIDILDSYLLGILK